MRRRCGDDAVHAIRFVVRARGVEELVRLLAEDAVAELDAPQAVDVQAVAIAIAQRAEELAGQTGFWSANQRSR